MNLAGKLCELDLSSENCVVIGSALLHALGLRPCRDIDVVVPDERFATLAANSKFKALRMHGTDLLDDGLFELRRSWTICGRVWTFNELLPVSTIIDGVRYITIEFWLEAKRQWIAVGEGREKDVSDVKLMESYIARLER